MPDISPLNVWPELDGKRVAGRAQFTWLSTDGSGNLVFVASSSAETHYIGSSSSTATFAPSTAQASTSIALVDKSGVFIWEQ